MQDRDAEVRLKEKKAELKEILVGGDLRAGLKYLNQLTPHRFTGLYLFEDPTLKNEYVYDEENPSLQKLPEDMPVTATYCSFTREKGSALAIENAREDERTQEHPARETIQSYCGVPLVNTMGEIYGTVCHFDYKPIRIRDETVRMMEALAPLIEKHYRP